MSPQQNYKYMPDKFTRLSTLILFFCLTILYCQSCTSARQRSIKEWKKKEWKLVKENKGKELLWQIYTRHIAGTDFIEYKIEGEVNSSPKTCILSFRKDLHNLAEDQESKEYLTYEIKDECEDSLLTYVIHNEPFPFKDTEMSVRYRFTQAADSNTEGVEWVEAWDDTSVPPPSRKLSRVETFRGAWTFSRTSNNFSKATNSVKFDPKKMPLWLVEPMVAKFLVKGLEKIREMVAGER